MDIENVADKAKAFLSDNRVTEALKTEKAEEVSDKVLDGAAQVANEVTGNKFTEQIKDARAAVDKELGNQ